MDKAKLEQLKGIAEQRCTQLFGQIQELTTELERTRGDFRTYESLLFAMEQDPEPIEPPKKKLKEQT